MGPEVARDEVVQAEPSWEAAGWGLHAWVKVGRLWASRRLLWVSSVGQEGGRESLAGPNIGGRGGDSCGRAGRVGWRVKKGKEEIKTKFKGKIFIQHQTTASI